MSIDIIDTSKSGNARYRPATKVEEDMAGVIARQNNELARLKARIKELESQLCFDGRDCVLVSHEDATLVALVRAMPERSLLLHALRGESVKVWLVIRCSPGETNYERCGATPEQALELLKEVKR